MHQVILITATIYGILAIILGAFGAHAFRKILTDEKLATFEVGVRYQMYGALSLLIIGYQADVEQTAVQWAYYGIAIGTFLFSFSIYFLSFATYWNVRLRFLGPITPIGGLFLLSGWISLLISFLP
ncbi:DUF423 domain-containing protein [Sphingobacterium suaedae]|uniref:DUF423 domain-containing protein n=1 Tax=Sphingobacterium suaedae TaxID=1686402 RepID=A0ABW5KHD9_9SPHI